jgi:hypothetical protein
MIAKPEQFAADLDRLIRGRPLRPFTCDGSPFDCDTLVIGSNPATVMDFRRYWDGERFDKALFDRDYRAKKGDRLVGTRPRLRVIAQHLRAVETNVHSRPVRTESGLKRAD